MENLPIADQSTHRLIRREDTFEVFVPYVVQRAATGEASQERERDKVNRGGTILLVEDEDSIREMTSMYLTANGYRVIEAEDGAQAVMLWEKHEGDIDLVLTDLRMPGGLSGHQLVERLQSDRPDLKAVFVSGYNSHPFGEEMCLEETTGFLQKPYRLKNLMDLVQRCLGRGEAA